MIRVVEYVQADGTSPYKAWFDHLDPRAAAKVATAVLRLGFGNTSGVKGVGKIAEYRIDWGPGYRIYLGRDGNELIVLLGGGTKKQQQRDIAKPQRCSPSTGRVRPPQRRSDSDGVDTGFQGNNFRAGVA